MFHSYRFSFDEVAPSVDVLMRYLQVPQQEQLQIVDEMIAKTFDELKDTTEITGGYKIVECKGIDLINGKITCSDAILNTGNKIAGYMNRAEKSALFLCTSGNRFTTMSHSYQSNGDFLEAFVVEAIGSATVENAMDNIQKELEKEMLSIGMNISNRYSPGYCDWPLADQQSIFSAIGDNPTGITLMSSSLMRPIKSVSGIIGIGKQIKKYPYGCSICRSKTCVYRKVIKKNKER